ALRIGAGVVTLGVPPDALVEVAAQVTALMIKPIAGAKALEIVLNDTRVNALCLGPALGLGEEKAALVDCVLERSADERAPCIVLDADALTLLAADETLFARLHDRCVLTPHAGEFARLFPDLSEKRDATAASSAIFTKADATRAAAERAGCTVLFKGPDTVIAHPDGRCSTGTVTETQAAPWLATAGSGDVLAGFVTGLLARGFDPFRAAETAAYLHTECAISFGAGLVAEDIPEQVPAVFRALGL
ncbi:MAG TPA: bifunctional ADP-dependent NAD(P)H-hydrate dehydratase/NAD(P)H-hydrate epimerase, partial [Octadecabacter sp.]|nr:bifunctional ADP-dependent NAD(P)H-hydrate dehydratase/NAD(P)H-hydrate epimerase [Octadecabacter sp.]